jgi:hypothetical protein
MTRPPVAAVGLDLSLTAAGIATPRGLFTEGETGRKGATLAQRRDRLNRQTARVLDRVLGDPFDEAVATPPPLVVAIESPAQHMTTGHQHDRSGLWWRVVHELSTWTDVHVVEVSPSARAKYATGKGNAAKSAVLAAVIRRYPEELVSNDNEADALVLRAMVLDHFGFPLAPVPALHREALTKVDWPALPVLEAVAR